MLSCDDAYYKEIACNFCQFLTFHDDNLTMFELLGFDYKAQEVLQKQTMTKVWAALNDLG